MRLALAAFALLQAGDVLTTALALGNGAHEGNPFAAAALAYGGWNALLGLKIWLVALVCGAAYLLPGELLAPLRGALLAANVVMAFVVLSNAGLALR